MSTSFLPYAISYRRCLSSQREADRAPAMVVLSLPERVWTPDIVWEKEDDSSEGPGSPSPEGGERSLLTDEQEVHDSQSDILNDPTDADPSQTHPPLPIHPSIISSPPLLPPLTETNPSFSPTLPAHPPLSSSTDNAGPSRNNKNINVQQDGTFPKMSVLSVWTRLKRVTSSGSCHVDMSFIKRNVTNG